EYAWVRARVGRDGVRAGDCERWLQALPVRIGRGIWLQKVLRRDLRRHAQPVERRETSGRTSTEYTAQLDEMAVEGALRGDLRLVYQAIAHDLLMAAMLSLAESR